MDEQKGYYQEMGPFGTAFWVGYGGGMAVLFWGALVVGFFLKSSSGASFESATSGFIFMNIIAVLMGLGHADSSSVRSRVAAQVSDVIVDQQKK